MSNTDIIELLQCDIGGVNIKVTCESGLLDGLANVRRRMADFDASGRTDFELTILLSKLNRRSEGLERSAQILVPDLMKLLPPRRGGTPKEARLNQRLKHLGETLLLIDFDCGLSLRSGELAVIPLEAGFILVDTNQRNALLILDRSSHPALKTRHNSLRVSADVTVLNSIMALVAFHLADREGVIAHGVGVCHEEGGYLFLAPSRGGKTTLSAQSPPGAVLADDGVIVKKMREVYTLYPTPLRQRPGGEIMSWDWHGKPVSLRALFVLGRGREVRMALVPRPKLIGLLLGSYTHFYLCMDNRRASLMFDFWRQISLKLPAAEMDWRCGKDFWPEIERFLARGVINYAFKERQERLAQGI